MLAIVCASLLSCKPICRNHWHSSTKHRWQALLIHTKECDRNKLCCCQKHAKIIFSHLLSAAPVISEQTAFLSSHLINRHHKQLININMTGVDWISLLQTVIKARSGIQTLANTQAFRCGFPRAPFSPPDTCNEVGLLNSTQRRVLVQGLRGHTVICLSNRASLPHCLSTHTTEIEIDVQV